MIIIVDNTCCDWKKIKLRNAATPAKHHSKSKTKSNTIMQQEKHFLIAKDLITNDCYFESILKPIVFAYVLEMYNTLNAFKDV